MMVRLIPLLANINYDPNLGLEDPKTESPYHSFPLQITLPIDTCHSPEI